MAKFKKNPFDKKLAFLTRIFSKRINTLNCYFENYKYSETSQKLKIG